MVSRDDSLQMLTRRDFLKVGAGGALVLATARLGRARPLPGSEDDAGQSSALTVGARDVLAAIVPVMLEGALPSEGAARAERIVMTIEGVDRAVAGLPPHAQRDLRDLFTLLGFAPARRLLAGVRQPWPEASAGEVAAFLRRWQKSGWALKQQAYQALHELTFAAFYANAASWPAIDYPGPPRLG